METTIHKNCENVTWSLSSANLRALCSSDEYQHIHFGDKWTLHPHHTAPRWWGERDKAQLYEIYTIFLSSGPDFTTVHFFHSAFLSQKTRQRKTVLHIAGNKNISKWEDTILPQQAVPKQWCCCKVLYKLEKLSTAKIAVLNLKSNLGSFPTHHQS